MSRECCGSDVLRTATCLPRCCKISGCQTSFKVRHRKHIQSIRKMHARFSPLPREGKFDRTPKPTSPIFSSILQTLRLHGLQASMSWEKTTEKRRTKILHRFLLEAGDFLHHKKYPLTPTLSAEKLHNAKQSQLSDWHCYDSELSAKSKSVATIRPLTNGI